MPASLLILLAVCALVLIGLPLLYRQRSERRWYLDIRARGIAVTAEEVSLTSLTRRSGGPEAGSPFERVVLVDVDGTILDFAPADRGFNYELGLWGQTLDRWQREAHLRNSRHVR